MIEQLHISGYRSIRECELTLGPLTVLIGPNNAGKTNVLRAIQAPGQVAAPLVATQGPWWKGTADWGEHCDIGPPVEARIRARTGETWVHTRPTGGGVAGTGSEHSVTSDPGGSTPLSGESAYDALATLRATPIYALELPRLRESSSLNVGQGQARRDWALDPTGRDLPYCLVRMQADHPENWERLNDDLRRCAPEVRNVYFAPEPNGTLGICFAEAGRKRSTVAREASDGLLLLTAFLAIRYSSDVARVLLLEDPERGLHPRRIQEVTDTLIELSQGDESQGISPTQVVVTTHSPYFLDRFRDNPDSVIVVERTPERGTYCTPLEEKLAHLPSLKDSSLGELWYSGVLGGTPR